MSTVELPTIQELQAHLSVDDVQFSAWRNGIPDKHWAKLDLSALRIGYELGMRLAQPKWRCFHCDDTFTDSEQAAMHFGTKLSHSPACQIDAAEYRRMEANEKAYAEEDAAIHRTMRARETEHQQALRRAEEEGYARGLRDSGLCPCTSAPVAAI